jgi:hypothetical protein
MGDLLVNAVESAISWIVEQAVRGMKWGWLFFLKYTFPRWWPDYLREELQPALDLRIARLADVVSKYDRDHWATLKSQLPAENRQWSVNSIGDAVRMVEFQIDAWGNTYTVYVQSGSHQATPEPREGCVYLQQTDMEMTMQRVYQLVASARDEEDRRRRAAERERLMEEQRKLWLAEEKRKGEGEKARIEASYEKALAEAEGHEKALAHTVDRIKVGLGKIDECDLEIDKLSASILAAVRAAKPVMDELEEKKAKMFLRVASASTGKVNGEEPFAELHKTYTKACSDLRDKEEGVKELLKRRAEAYQLRTKIRERLEGILGSALSGQEAMKKTSFALEDCLTAILNDQAVDTEWRRVETRTQAAQNDWSKTRALLGSSAIWHLTKHAQSREKTDMLTKMKDGKMGYVTRCQNLVNFIKASKTPDAKEEEEVL